MAKSKDKKNLYSTTIDRIFFDHFKKGSKEFTFDRAEIETAAKKTGLPPKNLGDLVYSFRYRQDLPEEIQKTCPAGTEWIITGAGRARYRFRLVPITRIKAREGLFQIKVPNATPEIVEQHALSDEQAVLAKVRYNRLIDLFTGLVTYSLQNHLRTTVKEIGQVEVDELYVGVSKGGAQYILPVQAKGPNDRIGRVQLEQDIAYCLHRFPQLICRPVGVQLLADDVIAMFELTVIDDQAKILEERQYRLVPAEEISAKDLDVMRRGEAPARSPKK